MWCIVEFLNTLDLDHLIDKLHYVTLQLAVQHSVVLLIFANLSHEQTCNYAQTCICLFCNSNIFSYLKKNNFLMIQPMFTRQVPLITATFLVLIIFTCFSKIASLACSSTKNGLAKTKPDPLWLLLSPTLKVGAGSLLNAGVGSFLSSTLSLSDSSEDGSSLGSFLISVLLKSMTADRFFTKCIEPTSQTVTLFFDLLVIQLKFLNNSNFYLHGYFLWARRGVFSFRVTFIISY